VCGSVFGYMMCCEDVKINSYMMYLEVHVAFVLKFSSALLVLPLCYVDLVVFGIHNKDRFDLVSC
jgi:hypothetical protein